MKEVTCVFAAHNTPREVEKFFCCGYETKEEHECMFGDCSWVDFCFKKIMNEVDFKGTLMQIWKSLHIFVSI